MAKKYAVALGIFDGVHIGHREVIDLAVKNRYGFAPGVFSFKAESVPQKKNKKLEYIYTSEYKEKIIQNLGVEKIFDAVYSEIKDMSGYDFCKNILVDYFNAGAVFCGRDFRFGKNAAWSFDDLKDIGIDLGFEVYAAGPVLCEYDKSKKVSSSIIRSYLKSGEIKKANKLLKDKYTVSGVIKKGMQIGRTIDFPTVNQYFENGQIVPKYGVYSSCVNIDGKKYKSVTSIGVKPTVTDENKPLSETYIIGFSGDLYNKNLDIMLKDYIREEKKFSGIEELKENIARDVLISSL